MSQSEFHALTEEERRSHVTRILSPIQSDDENVKLSEDEEAGSDTEPAEAEWRSGEAEVNAARAAGVWPDGRPLGTGHDTPYMKPRWARATLCGDKTMEGRPNQGVRSSPPTKLSSPPTIPLHEWPDLSRAFDPLSGRPAFRETTGSLSR